MAPRHSTVPQATLPAIRWPTVSHPLSPDSCSCTQALDPHYMTTVLGSPEQDNLLPSHLHACGTPRKPLSCFSNTVYSGKFWGMGFSWTNKGKAQESNKQQVGGPSAFSGLKARACPGLPGPTPTSSEKPHSSSGAAAMFPRRAAAAVITRQPPPRPEAHQLLSAAQTPPTLY